MSLSTSSLPTSNILLKFGNNHPVIATAILTVALSTTIVVLAIIFAAGLLAVSIAINYPTLIEYALLEHNSKGSYLTASKEDRIKVISSYTFGSSYIWILGLLGKKFL